MLFEIIGILFLIYLFLIAPRVFHRPHIKPFKNWHYAHRGFHDNTSEAPENSLAAFQKAIQHGYGIELDIQLSKDNQLVVFHDDDLSRTTGDPRTVAERSYQELQTLLLFESDEKIPLFKEVLDLVRGQVPLIVELKSTLKEKDERIGEIASDLLDDYAGEFMVESFHPMLVLWFKKHRKHWIRGQLSKNYRLSKEATPWIGYLLTHLLFNVITRPDFVAYRFKDRDSFSLRCFKYFFRGTTVAFTVVSQEELEASKQLFDLAIFEGFHPTKPTDD